MNTWGHVPTGPIEISRSFGLNHRHRQETDPGQDQHFYAYRRGRKGLCRRRYTWTAIARLQVSVFRIVSRTSSEADQERRKLQGKWSDDLTTYGSSGVEAISAVEAASYHPEFHRSTLLDPEISSTEPGTASSIYRRKQSTAAGARGRSQRIRDSVMSSRIYVGNWYHIIHIICNVFRNDYRQ